MRLPTTLWRTQWRHAPARLYTIGTLCASSQRLPLVSSKPPGDVGALLVPSDGRMVTVGSTDRGHLVEAQLGREGPRADRGNERGICDVYRIPRSRTFARSFGLLRDNAAHNQRAGWP